MPNADPSYKSTIAPITTETVSSFRQIITVLLPVRYPDKFYTESVANPGPSSLARVALWHESNKPDQYKAIGGIQCRLEDTNAEGAQSCYIQTIGVLAPYRELGIASQLLESVLATVVRYYPSVKSLSAHVWEMSPDVVEWYQRREFEVDRSLVQGYYRKLKPAGAWFLTRKIGVPEHLKYRESDNEAPEAIDDDTEERH